MHRAPLYRVENAFETFSVVYGRQPAASVRETTSTTAPNSIDLAFLPHERSIVRRANGRTEMRSFAVGQGGMHGFEPIEFIQVETPAEYMEIRVFDGLLAHVGDELGHPALTELPERHDIVDPVLWSVCARLRADILGGWPIDSLVAEQLLLTLTMHLMVGYLGAAPRRATQRPLDARRLRRVDAFVEAHLPDPIRLQDLADVASVSPYHFIRAFRAAAGLTPHEFVLSKRMERARQAIQCHGSTVAHAAASVGYKNAPHFRNAFKRYFGATPSRFGQQPD